MLYLIRRDRWSTNIVAFDEAISALGKKRRARARNPTRHQVSPHMHRHGTQLRLFDFSGAVDGGRDFSQKGNSTAPGRSVVTLKVSHCF